jgi:hypothetical protein
LTGQRAMRVENRSRSLAMRLIEARLRFLARLLLVGPSKKPGAGPNALAVGCICMSSAVDTKALPCWQVRGRPVPGTSTCSGSLPSRLCSTRPLPPTLAEKYGRSAACSACLASSSHPCQRVPARPSTPQGCQYTVRRMRICRCQARVHRPTACLS